MTRLNRLILLGAIVVAPAVVTRPAEAQAQKAAAEALFGEGRKLMAAGRTSEACPKFEASERLDPSPSTLLNLANCYEKAGRKASAWATYAEAGSLAQTQRRPEMIAAAQRHAKALEPQLSHVIIAVPTPVTGLEVLRDGVAVSAGEWGVAIPVDAGAHEIQARAAGKKPWSTHIEVRDGSASQTVTIPPLEDDDSPKTEPATTTTGADGTTTAPHPPPTSSVTTLPPSPAPATPDHTQRNAAFIVGGIGVAGLLASGAVVIAAKSKYDSSRDQCPNDKNLCTAEGVDQRNQARTLGDVATGLLIGGAAVAALGVVLYVTAPKGEPTSGRLSSWTIGYDDSPAASGPTWALKVAPSGLWVMRTW